MGALSHLPTGRFAVLTPFLSMNAVWAISCLKGSNKVALGYDEGTFVVKLGQEEPVVRPP